MDNKATVYRQWLSPSTVEDGGSSYVIARVEAERSSWRTHDLEIKDCKHSVNLIFRCSSPAEKKRSLKKLEKIKAAISFIEQGLLDD